MRPTPVLLCLFLAAFPAAGEAQTSAAPSEQLTVVAPYLLRQRVIRTDPRQPVLAISLEGSVPYGDLDLSLPADVATLQTRIDTSARALCAQIEKSYPQKIYVPIAGQDCAKSAADQAMFAVKFIIDFWRAP